MIFLRKPVIDQWYRHLDKGERFRVVAIDEDEETVDIQDFDGDIEEIDLGDWYAMEIESIAPPEDWTGPMDDIEHDDLGYSDTPPEEREWSAGDNERLAEESKEREDEALWPSDAISDEVEVGVDVRDS
jgi:uncharacterized protein DUF6763